MEYLKWYFIIGILFSLSVNLLNDFVLNKFLPEEDRMQFNTLDAILMTIFWPGYATVFMYGVIKALKNK